MAVGDASRRILLEFMHESVVRVTPGLVLGVVFAMALVPLLGRGDAADVAAGMIRLASVAAVAAAMLLVIAIIAALEPALRAARLDPQEVLRSD